jgi:hypothetical protein
VGEHPKETMAKKLRTLRPGRFATVFR